MNKSLELLVSDDTEKDVNLMPSEVFMPYPVHALIINCQSDVLQSLESQLSHARNLDWDSVNSCVDYPTPKGGSNKYNLLLLVLPNDENQALIALEHAATYNIDIILLGCDTPPGVLRLAFQHKVSDFITLGAANDDLLESISNVSKRLEKSADLAPLIAVLNGKSGSGASFIATSLAVISAARKNSEVALVDSDLHHGTLAHMLGMKPNYFITDALHNLDQLDAVALNSAMTQKDQLHLLAAQPFWMLNNNERIPSDKMQRLLMKCRQHYQQVVVDLSRGPEHWNMSVLEEAEILLVLQPNVISIRETKALVEQLTHHMGIGRNKIHLLVNRYEKSGSDITLTDIKQAVGIDSAWTVANDFKIACQCTNLGVPITDVGKHRRIVTDLNKITAHFFPQSQEASKSSSGIWSRLFGS